MPFAAITYPVQEGHDREVAEIFAEGNYQRVDSPVMVDQESGEIIGFLIATGLFLSGSTMVRVIQHEGGTVADIAAHMSVQTGVHEAERELLPHLSVARDTRTPAGFTAHFFRSLLTELDQWGADNQPAAGLTVLCYPIRPGTTAESVQAACAGGAGDQARFADYPGVVRTALFLRDGEFVLRVLQHGGGEAAVLAHVTQDHDGRGPDHWLDPLLADALPRTVDARPMPVIAFMSAAIAS